MKRDEARSTQNVSLKKMNSHANNRGNKENVRARRILRSKHHLVIRIRNPAVNVQAAPPREHGPGGGVCVLGVDTIWRNVVHHTALRRLGKHCRKPFFGLQVTNTFTRRVHVPQEVCAECYTEHLQQRFCHRVLRRQHNPARRRHGRLRALGGCACAGCARWEKGARLSLTRGECGAPSRSRCTWNYARPRESLWRAIRTGHLRRLI